MFFAIKYLQGQVTGRCMGETREKEGSVGVICESDLGWLVSIDITCSNAVGNLACIAWNMWMRVNWVGRENFTLK